MKTAVKSKSAQDHPTRRNWIEISAALCALAVSAASLFIAVRQNSLMEKQLSASTWPLLQFDTSNLDEQGNPEISLEIKNSGIGPGKIRSFAVLYNGHPVLNSHALMEACCAAGQPVPSLTWISSTVNHSVLTANEERRFLRLKATPQNDVIWHRFNDERSKVTVHACYCSALDECWLFDSAKDDQQTRVQTCPAVQDAQFQG